MRPIATDIIRCVLCLSVGHMDVLCKKATETIEMSFGRLTLVDPRNHLIDGGRNGACSNSDHSMLNNGTTAGLLQLTAMLQTGQCHITSP